jgi:putative phosphoesterase
VRVLVLSDTHSPRRWRACPDDLLPHLDAADVILHAGDVCTPDVLDLLSTFAPVHVVLGNNDVPEVAEWGAPETLVVVLEGVCIGMIHDSGQRQGRTARLRRRFPTADLVVFGHSHIPLDEAGDGVRILNPGSPTDRRRQPAGTYAWLELRDGEVVDARIEQLPR